MIFPLKSMLNILQYFWFSLQFETHWLYHTPLNDNLFFLFRIEGTNFSIVVETEKQIELSFTRTWDPSVEGKQSPLSIDRRLFTLPKFSSRFYPCPLSWWWVTQLYFRFVMLRDHPGFYSYAIFEHKEDFPGFNLNTARIAFMLNKDK